MRIRPILSALLLSGLASMAQALGLGEIQVKSALNDPFNASIELKGAAGVNADQLIVMLASQSEFDQMGVNREAVLLQLKFAADLKADPAVIRITSDKPIREPFLNFVLSLQSPTAQMLKEYTILLNPAK